MAVRSLRDIEQEAKRIKIFTRDISDSRLKRGIDEVSDKILSQCEEIREFFTRVLKTMDYGGNEIKKLRNETGDVRRVEDKATSLIGETKHYISDVIEKAE